MAMNSGKEENHVSGTKGKKRYEKEGGDTTSSNNDSILLEADKLVAGDRQWAYDHPWDNCSKIAKIWSVICEKEVEPRQVAMCMIGVKLAREVHRHKDDNLIDIAGYAQVAALAQNPQQLRKKNGSKA